ncbi:Nucleoside-diphosphate-sugar epimerase [Cnuella takakiae]|uniref:Nucleoside-diphosphate-sugar epimerase n=1 Tax=Cnuella takakiae TaxID=1302690 RepID=A0A1M5B9G9_9BACT|nr:NAD-dependent epimerase/dehydratase family protein [Cnuella takakiae]OLY93378.1 UDP-galactose-4-epimerase [Cnuella takakiae]SHF38812.1 Nucleoside-diphosphate-sugar epimerase [Cnuella takakiae]
MKTLLTGGNGFLGRQIALEMKQHGKLVSMGRSRGDLVCDLAKEQPRLDELFDLVVHCAGKAHMVPRTAVEAQAFFDTNLNGTKNLCSALTVSGFKGRFIFISTVAVYGLSRGMQINEETALGATEPYGKSKVITEAFVKEWAEQQGVQCTVLRLPLIAGDNPPGNLGAMIAAIKKGFYFNIAGGKARKSMVLATDVAHAIIPSSLVPGTYNLTDGIHPSFEELSTVLANKVGRTKVYNMPYTIAKLAALFGDLVGERFPLNTSKLNKILAPLTFDDSKARNAFGWNPKPVLGNISI